ncbi:hypothetical protein [Brachybacterium aquaticum]|uniref:Uncharacterized protein n=1 Tax=Brachybacterium aquaticum TaxID=1432564 RepID=A0A841AAN7_9MICO|nr:hypothetical protein [Brachybacterium aquaticum]MBB5831916.1 hypothetical protein [Brachybacterium aquaticum]
MQENSPTAESLHAQIANHVFRFQKAYEKDPESFANQLEMMWTGLSYKATFEVEISEDPCIVVRYHLDHRGDPMIVEIAAVDERGRPIASQRVEQGHALWQAYQGWLALYDPDGEFEDVLEAAAAEVAHQEPGTISHRELKAELALEDEE